MGRWRAPGKKASPYITAQGYEVLEQETVDIWKRRREVVKHLAAAAAEGDRSENAEYIYRKKELGEIDRRIRYLQRRMPELNVVTTTPSDPSRVFFGAEVELESEAGELLHYRIVGADEIDGSRGWISMDAPLAKALMKHGVDDEIRVTTVRGEQTYVIVSVSYPTT